jgi:predicted kinase
MSEERVGDARTAYAHVLWIGGASDAGKTTVARLLAERHRWQWYPCDFHEHNHLSGIPRSTRSSRDRWRSAGYNQRQRNSSRACWRPTTSAFR